jgi:hypothetical protein
MGGVDIWSYIFTKTRQQHIYTPGTTYPLEETARRVGNEMSDWTLEWHFQDDALPSPSYHPINRLSTEPSS